MNYVRLQFSRQNVEDLLHERGVDNNHATVMFMTLVAQQEREAISRHMKEALAVATARKLGSPNGAPALKRAGKGGAALRATVAFNANAFADTVAPDLDKLPCQWS